MCKFYEKREVLLAVLWIMAYCVVMAPTKGQSDYVSAVDYVMSATV